MIILLGREYILMATVVPYKKQVVLESINAILSKLNYLSPDLQGRRAVDIRNGKLILH